MTNQQRICYSIGFITALGLQAPAQQRPAQKDPAIEQLRSELGSVRAQLDSLRELISLSSAGDDIEGLDERLGRRLTELEQKIDAIARSTTPIVFNPRTTAFINFAARVDNKTVLDEKNVAEINNKPFLRGVELDLRAAVDPYAEAVAILSLEDEAGQGFAFDPEEVYGLLKRIPILESAPLGLKMKVGRFRAAFGANNRLHLHDLPWATRPLAVSKFLGTEHGDFFEGGYNPIGIDLDFFLPNPFPSSALEMNLDVVRAGDVGISRGRAGSEPGFLAHLNFSADWRNEHLLTLGASGYAENGTASTRLYGIDITYRWSPSEERASRSVVVGGEFFWGKHAYKDSLSALIMNSPRGLFAYAQYQVSYWLYLGTRYDFIQEPENATVESRNLAIYASYYTTEFFRLRLGVEKRWSDIPERNGTNTLLLEFNFVFGSHPTEPYWVNR